MIHYLEGIIASVIFALLFRKHLKSNGLPDSIMVVQLILVQFV